MNEASLNQAELLILNEKFEKATCSNKRYCFLGLNNKSSFFPHNGSKVTYLPQNKGMLKKHLTLKNHQGWKLTFNRHDHSQFTFELVDPWGIKYIDQDNVVMTRVPASYHPQNYALSSPMEWQELMVNLLQEQMEKIVEENRKYYITIEKNDGKLYVIFDRYGLAGGGGGRIFGFCMGAAQIGGGIFLTVFTGGLAAIPGSALIGSGVNGCVLTATAKDENLTAGEFVKTSLVGAATGLISGGLNAGAGVVAEKLATKGAEVAAGAVVKKVGVELAKEVLINGTKTAATNATTGALTSVGSTLAEAAIRQDAKIIENQLTLKNVIIGGVTNAVGLAIADASQNATQAGTKALIKNAGLKKAAEEVAGQAGKKAVKTAASAVNGAVAQGLNQASRKVIRNVADGKNVTEGMGIPVVVGVGIGAPIGGAVKVKTGFSKR